MNERTLRRASVIAFTAGGVGLLATLAGLALSEERFLRSYLVSYLFWLSIPLGCLALTMLHRLTGGAWGDAAQEILRSATKTLPAMALLFLPLALGAAVLFPWAQSDAGHELTGGKSGYLTVAGFWLRAVVYFLVWNLLAWALERRAAKASGQRGLAGIGLLTLTLLSSFAAIDWLMSLDPQWASTIYGVYFLGGQGVAALAFVILATRMFVPENVARHPLRSVHDWGKLLFAFLMLWAYFGFSQFLIIWMADLPEEATWYLRRAAGGWKAVSLLLLVVHFFVPFALLLSRPLKQKLGSLTWVALLLMASHWLDLYLQAAPAFYPSPRVGLADLATLVGVGGLFLGLFIRGLGGVTVGEREDGAASHA